MRQIGRYLDDDEDSHGDEQQRRIEQLERENQKLRLRAIKAEALVEFQKKAACLLGAEVTELSGDVC